MKIGITERGDAGLNLCWVNKLNTVDGTVLITKNLNDTFINTVLNEMHDHKFIIHCTCTGWGASIMEPNVPDYKTQLNQLSKLINKGFPAKNVVLRIDPIFPSEIGLQRVKEVLAYFHGLQLPENEIRYRMSIIDEYPHVRERYAQANLVPLYNGNFYPSYEQLTRVGETLSEFPYKFATCAEDKLAARFPNTFEIKGCVSKDDLDILEINYDASLFENPQKRSGCHCLSCKTELLTQKQRCGHNCLYCYWKN